MKKINEKIQFFRSFRGQLTLSVAIVVAITTSAFITVLTVKERALIVGHQKALDIGLARTLAVSSSIWVVSHDMAGLQELVVSILEYPEVIYVMITDEKGQVLAHTERSKIGKYSIDANKSLSPRINRTKEGLIDVTVPIMFSGQHVGWARIGLNHQLEGNKILQIMLIGLIYALMTILIGTLIALWIGNRITRSLYLIQDTMNKVAAGDANARTNIMGQNEVGFLAKEFNSMLDALVEREFELAESEKRFGKLFDVAAIPLCYVSGEGNLNFNFNQSFEDVFGYSHNDVPTLQEWWQLAYPDAEYRASVIAEWTDSVATAVQIKAIIEPKEYNVTCKNGMVRREIISGTVINGGDLFCTLIDVTELKQTEEKLVRSLRFTESLLKSIPIPVFFKDINCLFLGCNDAFTEFSGFSSNFIVGKNMKDLWPGDQSSIFQQMDLETLSSKGLKTFETKLENKEKNMRDVIFFKNLYYEENGSVAGIIGTFIDITEQKIAEVTLKKSQMLLKSSLESPQDMIIFSIDRKFNYLYFNDYHKKLMISYYGVEVMNGINMLECMGSDEDREKSKANFEKAFNGESHTSIEEYGTIEHSYFETRYNPIVNDENLVIGASAFSSNITTRILDEKKIQETNAYLENLINYANAPIIVWNVDLKITRFNHAFEALTGFRELEAIGKSLLILFPPESAEKSMELIHKTLTGERWEVVEIDIQHRDQSVRTVLWNSATIFSIDGVTPIATIAQGQDITERRKRELEIVQLNETLEQNVNSRTQQLEDSIKELETFSYSVSHDLRAPLRHIIAFSDMLTKEADNQFSDDSKHYLNIIIDSGKKMGILIDDLLNFSRTSRTELKKEPIDMNQIIENAKKQMQYSTNDRIIIWQIAKLPIIIGDYNLLLLVWVNLMDNALKYSQTRKESIIEIDFQEDRNETIFSIHDNGVGFDMKYVDKLFGIFQRLHSSSEFEGTGIGLANIQRIIKKHGGRVWATSEVEQGATFYFSLPNQ